MTAPTAPSVVQLMRKAHQESHPECEWGGQPHYVPPSLGDPGFYLCERGMLRPERPGEWPAAPSQFVAICPECSESWTVELPCDLGPDLASSLARLHVVDVHGPPTRAGCLLLLGYLLIMSGLLVSLATLLVVW